MSKRVLTGEERTSLALRTLYQKYGYLPYKMSKFEAYDLYVENKQFLVGDGVITFNDTDGKLMALKPDVTLSIIKNGVDGGEKRKVYYDERVYRISAKTKQFKEIQQVGLECLGEIDLLDVYETVRLAAESLASISDNFLLNISHLGVVSAILSEVGGEGFIKEATALLAEKNAHGAVRLCERYALSDGEKDKLLTLLSAYGDMGETLEKIRPLCMGCAAQAFDRLERLCALLQNTAYADKIRLDFSVDGDMHYYDDVVFKGYVEGIGESVLSGGRYDKLLSRMGRSSGAIGFAVYLDLLEGFGEERENTDVDVLLLYGEETDAQAVLAKAEEYRASGKSVRTQRKVGNIRYGELVDMTGGKV